MGSNIRVTTFSAGAQMSQIFNAPNDKVTLNVPSAGSNDARFMATNLSSASSAIELKPTGGNLPLGIIVTGVGSYKNTERKVEVAKPNWVIY